MSPTPLQGSAFGIVRNPYGLDQSTGGSSGGPAAAVAANFGMICYGSDTGRCDGWTT